MKKFIAAIDGLKYSESTVKYAVRLAKQTNAHLVGVFLDDFTYHSYKIYELVNAEGNIDENQQRMNEVDKVKREKSVHLFETACQDASITYTVHHDKSIALQELLHESVYADLLVINSGETFTHYEERIPTRFVRDLLSEVQCPVLVVPRNYNPIDKIALLYDGEPSSVYAVRTFDYLFSSLKHLPAEVLSVNEPKQSLHLPDNRLMKEFMKRHFPQAVYTVLKGDPEVEIVKRLSGQEQNTMVVLGAYRRSMVSRWFRPSMADTLMHELKSPLFITHGK